MNHVLLSEFDSTVVCGKISAINGLDVKLKSFKDWLHSRYSQRHGKGAPEEYRSGTGRYYSYQLVVAINPSFWYSALTMPTRLVSNYMFTSPNTCLLNYKFSLMVFRNLENFNDLLRYYLENRYVDAFSGAGIWL